MSDVIDTTNTNEIEELVRMVAELKLKNEELTKLANELTSANKLANGVGRLVSNGLPPLGNHNLTNSQSASFGNHTPKLNLDPILSVLEIPTELSLSALSNNEAHSFIWKTISSDGRLPSWSCETDIQVHVSNVLRDAIVFSGIKLETYRETSLSVTNSSPRPDLLVFRSNGAFVGICEVKKPSKEGNDLNKNKHLNQISNYLLMAKHYHGLRKPIGIVSTYNEWKFYWLEDAPDADTPLTSRGKDQERLHETRTFRYDDLLLVEALVSIVAQMGMSFIAPPSTFLSQQSSCDLTPDMWKTRKFALVGIPKSFKWRELPQSLKLNFRLRDAELKEFYLLEDFHGGADGRVWLATTPDGLLCVLKFSDLEESILKKEAEVWNTVWEAACACVINLLGCNAVAMPFAFHACLHGSSVSFRGLSNRVKGNLSVDSLLSSEVTAVFDEENVRSYYDYPLKVAEEALHALANKGFKHADLCWRHVALLPVYDSVIKLWKVMPILIDLTHVDKINPKDIEDVVRTGMDFLMKELQ